MLRVVTLSSRRAASLPLMMYFIKGDTSISAAALRIAQYSRSIVCSYDPTTKYPAHLRQFCGWHNADVRSWKGVLRNCCIHSPNSDEPKPNRLTAKIAKRAKIF